MRKLHSEAARGGVRGLLGWLGAVPVPVGWCRWLGTCSCLVVPVAGDTRVAARARARARALLVLRRPVAGDTGVLGEGVLGDTHSARSQLGIP